ncbi:hypothetical protein [Rhizobium sp. Leaf341]|nr:hypothetical protein [Rhizobium sp. Leaf341]
MALSLLLGRYCWGATAKGATAGALRLGRPETDVPASGSGY